MSHDRRDVATPGRWRMLLGLPRWATPVAPVDETTVDPTELAYERLLTNAEQARDVAENRLVVAQAKTEAILAHLAQRHRWAGKTRDEALGDVKHELFELLLHVTGKAK